MQITRNLFNLDGKVAIVTGGSRGIGKAICLGLSTFGASVAVAGVSPENQRTVQEITNRGGKAIFIPCDLSIPENSRRAVAKTVETFGKLDILVNNAGVATVDPAEKVTEEEWDRVIGVNLRGAKIARFAGPDDAELRLKHAVPDTLDTPAKRRDQTVGSTVSGPPKNTASAFRAGIST
ncbi:MAG: SDR family NAD(P)-dependent oxidoreductase [Firmicutes bacterium]|nr:SDR family NAD(P)-dependent oxidoreductase [Candidatus Fermentithermobacillaceae bacterium]